MLPPGDPVGVLQRVLDPDVPVQGDHTEAQYGGCRAHHVTAEARRKRINKFSIGG